ncbi:hypothetical protein GCM10009869_10790 [Amnibacterium kyonggiense]
MDSKTIPPLDLGPVECEDRQICLSSCVLRFPYAIPVAENEYPSSTRSPSAGSTRTQPQEQAPDSEREIAAGTRIDRLPTGRPALRQADGKRRRRPIPQSAAAASP